MNKAIKILIKTYLLVLIIFFIFRTILFATELEKLGDKASIATILKAFIMGVRFDIVISGYILFLPALVLLTLEILKKDNKSIYNIVFWWIFILFSISFIISSADIPYFNQFFERFSIGAFQWADNPEFVLSMILEEPKYLWITIPFIILEILFYFQLKKIFNQKYASSKISFSLNIILSILFLSVMFLGIRGRIQKKSPIRIGTAYFCDNALLNKLGLNPVFTLIKSSLDHLNSANKPINLIADKTAETEIVKYLKINKPAFQSPIARAVTQDTISTQKPNVIIIIMESMSAAKMNYFGNQNQLTPFLDSLALKSIFFENFYASGKHTFNGIFSTLFSFPALYRQHTMKQIRKYDGISSVLKKKGYSTTYFTTHDSQFDNIEGFFRANDFENIISQSDYPLSEVKTTLGVPDDYMFRFAIPKINELAKNKKPFFVTFMTASDHGPYYIPKYFKPKNKHIKQQITEYADWSLKKFFNMAAQQNWFDDTIFVLVADHGAAINVTYEIPLNYFHIPFIIYTPKTKQSKIVKNIGSQIDVFPTIMGLLKYEYVNNTLGIDLLNRQRKYAIINDDDKIGILDTVFLCVMKEQKINLYKYKNKDKTNYYSLYPDKALDMTNFAKVNLQITQKLILDKKTSIIDSIH